MKDYYLYAIVVENRIWGELSVCAGNHYEIHAIPVVPNESEEDTVSSYVWEMQADCSSSYGSPSCTCINCGDDVDDCECDEPDIEDEEESSFIESNSDARWVKYDETDEDHILCPGAEEYRDTSVLNKFLRVRELENKEQEMGRVNSKILSLEDELSRLIALRDKLNLELKELK